MLCGFTEQVVIFYYTILSLLLCIKANRSLIAHYHR